MFTSFFLLYMLPIIAIVGRPNVGKSTLFNRFLGEKRAIESDVPGTTRDRMYGEIVIGSQRLMLVDMAGLEFGPKDNLEDDIQTQARLAISQSQVILFVVDSREELTSSDFATAELLRKSKKPTIVVINKCDQVKSVPEKSWPFYELGFENFIQTSAVHGFGFELISKEIIKILKSLGIKSDKKTSINEEYINIAFLGRPNVGKSSLVNAILKEKRLVVSDEPGTTRDAVDSLFEFKSRMFNLIDTAGVRRRGKIERGIEYYSVLRGFQAIERCDVALLIIDYESGVRNQDCHVAEYILEQAKGLIIVVNKCDLMDKDEAAKDYLISHLKARLDFMPWAPVVFCSALDGQNIYKILDLAAEIKLERQKRIPTAQFNDWVEIVIQTHPPALAGGAGPRKPKIYYGTQVGVDPPHFLFFVNNKNSFHFSYKRYLENQLRKQYGFSGTAMKIDFKSKRVDESRTKRGRAKNKRVND